MLLCSASAGAHMDAVGSEGHPPLFYAIQQGVQQLQVQRGNAESERSAGVVAAGAGITDAAQLTARAQHIVAKLLPSLEPACQPRVSHLIPREAVHPGRGSLLIDDAVPAAVLDQLERFAAHPSNSSLSLLDRRLGCLCESTGATLLL